MARHWLRVGALTAAGLSAWLTIELNRTPAVPAPPPPAPDASLAELPRLEPELPVLASLRATLERPLFDDDRRPDPPVDAAGAGPNQPDASTTHALRLSAVIVAADGRRSVLVEVPGQQRPLLVDQGGQAGGWRVDDIGDEAVTLSAGGQRSVVPLRTFDSSPAKRATARPSAQRRPPEPARRSPARPPTPDPDASGGDAPPAGQQGRAAAQPTADHKNAQNKRN